MDRPRQEHMRVDEGDGRWITALAVSLIRQKSPVEDFLRKARRLGAFQDSIAAWNQQYPVSGPSEIQAKAQALVTIVHEYGLQGLVTTSGEGGTRARGAMRTRGAVRVRGAVRTRSGVQPAATPHEMMERVAAAYCRPS